MGKVLEVLHQSTIPNAQLIGCVTAADDLIVSSVSNWGGYALAAATGLIFHETALLQIQDARQYNESVKQILTTFLPTDEEEKNKCQRIVEAGARDGITTKLECMVDGMPLSTSLQVLQDIRNI